MASLQSAGHADCGTLNRKPCLGLGKVYHRGHRDKAQEPGPEFGLVHMWRRLVAKLMNRAVLTEVTSNHPNSHLLGVTWIFINVINVLNSRIYAWLSPESVRSELHPAKVPADIWGLLPHGDDEAGEREGEGHSHSPCPSCVRHHPGRIWDWKEGIRWECGPRKRNKFLQVNSLHTGCPKKRTFLVIWI